MNFNIHPIQCLFSMFILINIFNNKIEFSILNCTNTNSIAFDYIDDNIKLDSDYFTLEQSIKNGYVVDVYYTNENLFSKNKKNEIYNCEVLDRFIENIENKKSDKIRIVKYIRRGNKLLVSRLYDLEFNGIRIKLIGYDTYSNKKLFIVSDIQYYDTMIKKDYGNEIWYGVCLEGNKENNCISLISFLKDNTIN